MLRDVPFLMRWRTTSGSTGYAACPLNSLLPLYLTTPCIPGLVGGGSALIDFSTNTLQLLDVRNTSMSCSASDLSAISPNTSCSLPEGFKATAIIKEGTDRRLPVHCAVTLSKSQPNTLMRKDIMADPRFWHYSSCSCEKNWDGGSITLPASLVTVDGQLQPHCAPKGRAQVGHVHGALAMARVALCMPRRNGAHQTYAACP